MMSLSKEWALLSREMYGQEFVDELADFLQKQKVKTILECGCGDGYVLQGLAKRGFKGIGIDANPEMVALALKNHNYSNISYKQMSWLDIGRLKDQYDTVICRGNSLSCIDNWGEERINNEKSRKQIEESVNLFFQRLKQGGLIYVDTISKKELSKNGGDIEIKIPNIQLRGKIEYDWQRMERRVFGSGKVFGEDFNGGSASYLLTPDELESMIKNFNPSRIFRPKLKYEKIYDVICAIK